MENNSILSDTELNLDKIVNKILLQNFDNTYHNKIVLPNGEVLNSNYGLENCIIFNVNEINFTGKAKILGTLAIYLIINKSNDPNKKIPFFTDMNKETYGTYFRSFSNLDVNNNPFGSIFINYHFTHVYVCSLVCVCIYILQELFQLLQCQVKTKLQWKMQVVFIRVMLMQTAFATHT